MKVALEIQGKSIRWAVTADMPAHQIQAMREDGLEVGILVNSMPMWVLNSGLAGPWMFFQDLLNFKNPFPPKEE